MCIIETCTGTKSSTLTLPDKWKIRPTLPVKTLNPRYPTRIVPGPYRTRRLGCGTVGALYSEPAIISNGGISLAHISANALVTRHFVSAETLEIVGPLNIVIVL